MMESTRLTSRHLPDLSTPGIADARVLPADEFSAAWSAIILPGEMKEKLLRIVVAGMRLRAVVPFDALPLHGVLLLTGPQVWARPRWHEAWRTR